MPRSYPAMMLTALVETGTRGLLGAVFGPNDRGETAYPCRLLDRLTADILVLADRAFDGNDFLAALSRNVGAADHLPGPADRHGGRHRVSAGSDPDRASFTTALEAARDLPTAGRGVVPTAGDSDLVGDIGRAVLAERLPPRRLRTSIRKVKCPISRHPARRQSADQPEHHRHRHHALRGPRHPTAARSAIVVHGARPPAHRHPPLPGRRRPRGRQHRVLTILAAEPGRAWHGRELARMLGITNLNSFCVQLSPWSSEGIIRKAGRALYALADHVSMPLTSTDTA
ncbi:hypothetical protein ACL02U_26305 [Streptomyces sp. MS06]|uniref:hypothetical protein n=1 Tax=Streptomyces sp. MS06 TaxID=3385974 RepID=UPI0039A00A0C